MKPGWETKRLSELCSFSNGLWKGKNPPFKHVGVIRNTNFTKDGHLDDSDIAYLDVEAKQFETRSLKHGDIILEKSGGGPKQPVGRVVLFEKEDGDYSFSNFTAALRINNHKELYYRYLHYFLFGEYIFGTTEQMQSHSTGIRNLDTNAYKQIKVQFPSIAEQQRIVVILDKAFAAITAAKANDENNFSYSSSILDRYLQTLFRDSNNWPQKSVSDLAQHSLGKMLDKAKNRGTLQPYLRNLNVRWFNFNLSDMLEMKFLPEENAKYTAARGDVLVCEGGYPGRSAIWDGDAPVYFQKAIHRIRFHDPVHAKWFLYFIYHQDKSGQLANHLTGTGIRHFTGQALGRYLIPLPPKAEIVSIVKTCEALQNKSTNLQSVYKLKLAALNEFKQSLLAKALSGEL